MKKKPTDIVRKIGSAVVTRYLLTVSDVDRRKHKRAIQMLITFCTRHADMYEGKPMIQRLSEFLQKTYNYN